jgi:GTP-binding protein
VLVHLFDLRHEPTALDVQTWERLSSTSSCQRVVVGTKADRVGAAKKQQHQKVIARALGIATDDVVAFSAVTREGRPLLWQRILRAVGDAADAAEVGDVDGSDVDGSASPS